MSEIYRRLPLSHLAAADPAVALYRSVLSRNRHIQWQLDNQSDRLPPHVRLHARRDQSILDGIARRLVINSPIPPARADFVKFGTLDEHLDRLFGDLRIRRRVGAPDPDPVVRVALRRAAEQAARARKSTAIWRFSQALQQAEESGWYAVFNTLTVKPVDYYAVFSHKSRAFSRYIEAVHRAVGISAHRTKRLARQNDDFHRYFAVVESGDRTDRLHIHVVHLMRVLPAGVADPALAGRHCRKISAFKKFWQYGFSAPIAVRFGASDAFARAGWTWPESSDGAPARVGSWQALACYMAKYVSKSLTSNDRGDYQWRIRISRGLGTERLRATLRRMTAAQLLVLALSRPPTRNETRRHPEAMIPTHLLRGEATREIVRRMLNARPASFNPRAP